MNAVPSTDPPSDERPHLTQHCVACLNNWPCEHTNSVHSLAGTLPVPDPPEDVPDDSLGHDRYVALWRVLTDKEPQTPAVSAEGTEQ